MGAGSISAKIGVNAVVQDAFDAWWCSFEGAVDGVGLPGLTGGCHRSGLFEKDCFIK